MQSMATIVPSDLAPTETIHYSFAGVEFDLGGSGKGSKKTYATEDVDTISNAQAHPWLTVESESGENPVAETIDTQVRPEDDSQGALGPNGDIAFDQDEIDKIEEAKAEGQVAFDLTEPQTDDGVEDAAADDDAGDDS